MEPYYFLTKKFSRTIFCKLFIKVFSYLLTGIIINQIVVFFFDKTKRNRKNDMKLFLFILVHNSLSISVSGLTMEGTVIIKVDMDERGGSINIRIIKEAGFGFDEAALNMIKLSGFSPAHSDAVFIVYPANALTH